MLALVLSFAPLQSQSPAPAPQSFETLLDARTTGFEAAPQRIHVLGDVDDDGIAELVIADPQYGCDDTRTGAVFVLDALRQVRHKLAGAEWRGRHGEGLCALGDANGDGRFDFACGASQWPPYGYVEIYTGSDAAVWRAASGDANATIGGFCAPGGDADGDGRGDLLTADRYGYELALLGLRDGKRIRVWDRVSRGQYLGDVDGDGSPEYFLGPEASGRVRVESLRDKRIWGEMHVVTPQKASGVAVGDLDGDGACEIAIGDSRLRGGEACYNAPDRILALNARAFTVWEHRWLPSVAPARVELAPAGDWNLDGTPDVLIGWQVRLSANDPWAVRIDVLSGKDGVSLARLELPESELGGIAATDIDGDGLPNAVLGVQDTKTREARVVAWPKPRM